MKILMVCLGNICRSPLAEGLLQEKIKSRGLAWEVDSAGTGSWHLGEPPDPRSIQTAEKNGIHIGEQRARQLTQGDLDRFDLILAMDQSNYRDIQALAKGPQRDKVHMILNFVFPGENRSVPDPYWNDHGFDQVYQMLDKATDGLIEHLHSI